MVCEPMLFGDCQLVVSRETLPKWIIPAWIPNLLGEFIEVFFDQSLHPILSPTSNRAFPGHHRTGLEPLLFGLFHFEKRVSDEDFVVSTNRAVPFISDGSLQLPEVFVYESVLRLHGLVFGKNVGECGEATER